MKPINVGVLSKIPNLLRELQVKLTSDSLLNLARVTAINNCGNSKNDFKDIDVIVADYDLVGPHLYTLENVKFIQGTWAGIDALLPHIKPELKLNVPIFRFSGNHFGKIISEYVVACIVNHERDFFKVHDNQCGKKWSQEGKIHTYRTIYDMTIGVMGVGQIGSRCKFTRDIINQNLI